MTVDREFLAPAEQHRAIPITKPLFGEEELRAVQEPLLTGWVVQGPFVQQFEEGFSSFTGNRHSIATSSCTTALHVAVAALGLKPGDEVIIPAFTWVSTANVVEYMGAQPVFCDIDLETFNIDVRHLETLITPRTVGVVPVHLFGLCAPMKPLLQIANKHHLWVVEDAACAFGAGIGTQQAGSFGDLGAFSFHPRKSITTGEGGMLTTQSPELDELARSLRDHGASITDRQRHTMKTGFLLAEYEHLGFNYRMTDLQGALGCAQLRRANSILSRRAECAKRYDDMLVEASWLRTPRFPATHRHAYQAYVCLYSPEEPTVANVGPLHARRNALMQRLAEHGIATRQGTHAPVLLGYYAGKYGLQPEQFPNAYLADRLTMALPLFPQLTEQEQELVVRTLCIEQATG